MNLIAMKDLKTPRRLKERLVTDKELLLTTDGRPVAILVNVEDGDNPEHLLWAIRDSRSRLALGRVRDAARRSGAAQLSARQIEREISQARAARQSR